MPGNVWSTEADPAWPESDFTRDLEALCLNPAENHEAFKSVVRTRGYRQVEKAHGNNRPTDPRLASAWQRIDGSADLRIMIMWREDPVLSACIATAKGLDRGRMRTAIDAINGLKPDPKMKKFMDAWENPKTKRARRFKGVRFYIRDDGMKLRYLPRYYDYGGDLPEDDYLTITTGKNFLAVFMGGESRSKAE